MKNKAFTLIEMLVVVLIIAILAAIAVPKYQYSVLKSEYHTLMNMAQSFKEAQEIYYLANGRYTNNFNDLDISGPGGESSIAPIALPTVEGELQSHASGGMYFDNGNKAIALTTSQVKAVMFKNGKDYLEYDLRLDNVNMWGGARGLCIAQAQAGDMGIKLCKELSNGTCTIRQGGRSSCRLK